jgi:hypothetical protein
MSKAFPWYKREPRAFFDATIGWEFEEKSAYGLLLDLIYMHDGQVADDAAYVVAMLGLSSKRKWTGIKNKLIERGKIEVVDGYLRNHRAFIETINRRYSRDKSEITETVSNENNDLAKTDIEVEIEEEGYSKSKPYSSKSKSVSQSGKQDRQTDDLFLEFWDSYPHTQSSCQAKARTEWDRLSPDDQTQALSTAKQMDAPPRDLFAWTWIAQREWLNFKPPPKIIPWRPTPEQEAERFKQLQAAYEEQQAEKERTGT